jgi:hypothetical protein
LDEALKKVNKIFVLADGAQLVSQGEMVGTAVLDVVD